MDNPGFLFSLVYIIIFDMDVSYKFRVFYGEEGKLFKYLGGGGFNPS